jgi:hypothetical protein
MKTFSAIVGFVLSASAGTNNVAGSHILTFNGNNEELKTNNNKGTILNSPSIARAVAAVNSPDKSLRGNSPLAHELNTGVNLAEKQDEEESPKSANGFTRALYSVHDTDDQSRGLESDSETSSMSSDEAQGIKTMVYYHVNKPDGIYFEFDLQEFEDMFGFIHFDCGGTAFDVEQWRGGEKYFEGEVRVWRGGYRSDYGRYFPPHGRRETDPTGVYFQDFDLLKPASGSS